MNLMHTARIGALSAALVLFSFGPAGAVDPAPGQFKPPAGIAATCSTYGYACPSGLTCKFLAGPPQKMPPWDYVAYSCEVSGFVVPGGCPPGYVKSATGCKPGPKACAASVAKNQWHWTTGTLPLTSGTGYRCPYKHFSLQG
jgi:hypothetical protein